MTPSMFRALHACVAAAIAVVGSHTADAVSPTPPSGAIRLSDAQARAAGIKVDAARAAQEIDTSLSTSGWRLTGSVKVPPNQTGVIVSAVSGQVEHLYVHIGQTVRTGEPLARVYSADVLTMQRSYLHAKASADVASGRLERDQALFGEGIIAEARLRETQAARDMAIATQREQRRLLRLAGHTDAEIDLLRPESISTWVTLRAGSPGVVLEQPAQVGQHIEAGATLFKLAAAGKWWLELEATRAQATDIRLGDLVRVDGCQKDGRVIAVGSQLNATSQTLTIRGEMPEGLSCITPNEYIQARVLPSANPAGLVSVPASALIRNGNGEFVFVERTGDFQPTAVSVSRRQGNEVLLSHGVEPGDRVASSGLIALKGAWLGLGAQSPSNEEP